MKPYIIRYLVGIIFLLLGFYKLSEGVGFEGALYIIMGFGFIIMGIVNTRVWIKYEKLLTILSWILIITAGLMFLYLIQTDIK